MKWSIGSKIGSGFGLALVALMVVGAVSYNLSLIHILEGITRLDGILFIHNLEHFLSKKEEKQLDELRAQAAGRE